MKQYRLVDKNNVPKVFRPGYILVFTNVDQERPTTMAVKPSIRGEPFRWINGEGRSLEVMELSALDAQSDVEEYVRATAPLFGLRAELIPQLCREADGTLAYRLVKVTD